MLIFFIVIAAGGDANASAINHTVADVVNIVVTVAGVLFCKKCRNTRAAAVGPV